MSLFTLERLETNRGCSQWREIQILFRTAELALEAATRLWEADDVLVEAIRLKRTEVLCTLMPPGTAEAER